MGKWLRGLNWLRSRVTALLFCLSQSPSVLDGMCTEDVDCPVGNPVVHGNGTGCFAKNNSNNKKVLIPHAW